MEKIPFGWKACRHCNELVHGRRTLICPHCQGNLAKLDSPNSDSLNEDGEAVRLVWNLPGGYNIPEGHINRVTIPAGVPPIALTSDDDEIMLEWAQDVRQALLNDNVYIENPGLIYWAFRTFGGNHSHIKATLGSLPDIVYKEVPIECT